MDTFAIAGIEFVGSVMRYSEIEHFGNQFRLLRLGNCDFEFDVSRVVFHNTSPSLLETVSDAVADVFSGLAASRLRIAVHQPFVDIFSSAAGADMDAAVVHDQMTFESAMADVSAVAGKDVHVFVGSETRLMDGTEYRNVQSVRVDAELGRRLERVLGRLGDVQLEVIAPSEAVSRLIRRKKQSIPDDPSVSLAVGLYEDHTAISIYSDGAWSFGYQRPEIQATDILYFVLSALGVANPDRFPLTVIRSYGERRDGDLMEQLGRIFSCPVESLDPTTMLELDSGQFEDGFPFESFAVCMGAALR